MGSAFVRRARHALHDQRSRSLALGATVGIYFSRVGFVSSWIFKFQPARRWAQQDRWSQEKAAEDAVSVAVREAARRRAVGDRGRENEFRVGADCPEDGDLI